MSYIRKGPSAQHLKNLPVSPNPYAHFIMITEIIWYRPVNQGKHKMVHKFLYVYCRFLFFFQSNIPFLLNVLQDENFLSGTVYTHFIDTNPQLFKYQGSKNRAQKLLYFLAETFVNGSLTPLATTLPPADTIPTVPATKGKEKLCIILYLNNLCLLFMN